MTKNPTPSNEYTQFEKMAIKLTSWIGSPASLAVHSLFFVICFVMPFFGIPFEQVLLVLTTVVSLEAIYLAIFIQMTVNRNTESLEEVEEDIDEIQGDIDEIQEDVDEIQEEVVEDDEEVASLSSEETLSRIHVALNDLAAEIDKLKK